jgi:hypothetical protein
MAIKTTAPTTMATTTANQPASATMVVVGTPRSRNTRLALSKMPAAAAIAPPAM